jgi:hypothetical protein
MMKVFIPIIFLLVVCGPEIASLERLSVIGYRSSVNVLNRTAFYKALESNDKELVNAQLQELNTAPSDVRDAFTGAMIMKKAGLGGNPASKLRLFREGHKMLEAAIKSDPKNSEFRFLRLVIQENSPNFLGYKNDVEEDSEYIRKSYKSLPDEVQHAIANYNKKSRFLKLEVP